MGYAQEGMRQIHKANGRCVRAASEAAIHAGIAMPCAMSRVRALCLKLDAALARIVRIRSLVLEAEELEGEAFWEVRLHEIG